MGKPCRYLGVHLADRLHQNKIQVRTELLVFSEETEGLHVSRPDVWAKHYMVGDMINRGAGKKTNNKLIKVAVLPFFVQQGLSLWPMTFISLHKSEVPSVTDCYSHTVLMSHFYVFLVNGNRQCNKSPNYQNTTESQCTDCPLGLLVKF